MPGSLCSMGLNCLYPLCSTDLVVISRPFLMSQAFNVMFLVFPGVPCFLCPTALATYSAFHMFLNIYDVYPDDSCSLNMFRVPCSLMFLMFPQVLQVPYAPRSLLRVPRFVFLMPLKLPRCFLFLMFPDVPCVPHSLLHIPGSLFLNVSCVPSYVPCSLRSTDLVACSTFRVLFFSDDPCSLRSLMFHVPCVPHSLFHIPCSMYLNGSDLSFYVPCSLRSTDPAACSTFRVLICFSFSRDVPGSLCSMVLVVYCLCSTVLVACSASFAV